VTSVGLAWIVLLREPSRVDALGLSLATVRGRVPIVVMFGLAGGVATYAVNAVISLGYIMLTGGIEKHIGMAKEQQETFSTFAAIPLYVMLPVVVLAGVYEDIVFRGFLLGRLRILFRTSRGWMGDVASIVVSSVIFGLGHIYQGWFGVMKTTAAGACLAILVLLTKSVWPAMIAHAGIDAATIVMLHFLSPLVSKALEGK
jgi:membrane protease YdiL (CAAX protease family)